MLHIPTTPLPSGEAVPILGLGTWRMGERSRRRRAEADALRLGLDLGFTLIDTAEMYGEGGAEEVIAEALAGRREGVFLVSKVYPHNASRHGAVEACERSLRRLRTDRIDLYLLHWPGSIPLAETVEAFEALRRSGKIRYWGVSNFDAGGMQDLVSTAGGSGVAANQVLYNLARREAESELCPWCRERGIPLMAYCPIDQGDLAGAPVLEAVAARYGASAAQVALAWLLAREGVIAIPKAVDPAHLRENRAAVDLHLGPEDLEEIDDAFPPPQGSSRLQMR